MTSSSLSRELYDSNLAWARAEYARIQEVNRERYPNSSVAHEPGEKSALFARLLSGKLPLPFPPPTSFAQPWYDVIEERGPFSILLGGTIPAWDVTSKEGTIFLEYLIINACPWGVVSGNEPAAHMADLLSRLRECKNREEGDQILNGIEECLHNRPEWIVRVEPWPEYKVYLGRVRRQGKRLEIESARFLRHSYDGTNSIITRVLIDGKTQLAGKADRLEKLRSKAYSSLSLYERKALADIQKHVLNPSALDWVEYESDSWQIELLDKNWASKVEWYKG